MLKESKAASVVMNEMFICIETYSGRGLMGRDPDGVCEFHELDTPSVTLGSSLRKAVDASRWISLDEYPLFFDTERFKEINRGWAEAASGRFGYKSKKALFKKMMSCSVRCVESLVTLRPSVHVKLEAWTGDGIDPSQYVEVSLQENDDVLGERVRMALSRCR